MKKKFDFGKIDFEGRGKSNAVVVEVKYDNGNFSACGEIWNRSHTDVVCGGQCLDTIAQYIKDDPIFDEIYYLWQRYHLNDMHAECVHQNELGWRDIAKKEVTLYHWSLKTDMFREQNKIKNGYLAELKKGNIVDQSAHDVFVLNLALSLTTYTDELPNVIAEFYDPKKSLYSGCPGHTEKKMLGWLRESEHPDGILCKPCPVCGYRYGTSWIKHEIPDNDKERIERLFENDGVFSM